MNAFLNRAPSRSCLRIAVACLLAGACCLPLCGCGKGYDTVPVSGTITRGDQPVSNAIVNFQPVSGGEKNINPGPGSYGKTDENGKYTLMIQGGDSKEMGAVPGPHRVTIIPDDEGQSAKSDKAVQIDPAKRIPEPYLSKGVTFKVPPDGTTEANFDVLKPPPQ